MTDVWVCSNCKSINRLRDSRCYSCGQRQEQVAAATEHTPNVRLTEAIANRAARGYQSSTPYAIAAGVLIVATAFMGLYLLVLGLRDVEPLRAALADAIRTGS